MYILLKKTGEVFKEFIMLLNQKFSRLTEKTDEAIPKADAKINNKQQITDKAKDNVNDNGKNKDDLNNNNINKEMELQNQLQGIVSTSNNKLIIPESFKKAIEKFNQSFSGNYQQDATEFFSYLLDILHEETNLNNKNSINQNFSLSNFYNKENENKKNYFNTVNFLQNLRSLDYYNFSGSLAWSYNLRLNASLVNAVFSGQLQSTLVCEHCRHEKSNFETFNIISLPVLEKSFIELEIYLFRLPFTFKVYYKNFDKKFDQFNSSDTTTTITNNNSAQQSRLNINSNTNNYLSNPVNNMGRQANINGNSNGLINNIRTQLKLLKKQSIFYINFDSDMVKNEISIISERSTSENDEHVSITLKNPQNPTDQAYSNDNNNNNNQNNRNLNPYFAYNTAALKQHNEEGKSNQEKFNSSTSFYHPNSNNNPLNISTNINTGNIHNNQLFNQNKKQENDLVSSNTINKNNLLNNKLSININPAIEEEAIDKDPNNIIKSRFSTNIPIKMKFTLNKNEQVRKIINLIKNLDDLDLEKEEKYTKFIIFNNNNDFIDMNFKIDDCFQNGQIIYIYELINIDGLSKLFDFNYISFNKKKIASLSSSNVAPQNIHHKNINATHSHNPNLNGRNLTNKRQENISRENPFPSSIATSNIQTLDNIHVNANNYPHVDFSASAKENKLKVKSSFYNGCSISTELPGFIPIENTQILNFDFKPNSKIEDKNFEFILKINHRIASCNNPYLFYPIKYNILPIYNDFILQVNLIPIKTSNLYTFIWEKYDYLLNNPEKYNNNLWWRNSISGSQKGNNSKKCCPFALKILNKENFSCPKCPWFKFCNGCILDPLESEFVQIKYNQIIIVDWCFSVFDTDFVKSNLSLVLTYNMANNPGSLTATNNSNSSVLFKSAKVIIANSVFYSIKNIKKYK